MKPDKVLVNLILENQIIIMKALTDISDISNSKKNDLNDQIKKTLAAKKS